MKQGRANVRGRQVVTPKPQPNKGQKHGMVRVLSREEIEAIYPPKRNSVASTDATQLQMQHGRTSVNGDSAKKGGAK